MNTEIVKITSLDGEAKDNIAKAAKILNDGGLVVFPTETVYGLGADATNVTAVASVFSAKGRPSDNPLIIHIAQPEDAEKYAHTTEAYYRLARAFMPGPLTVILKSKDTIPERTRGGLSTVAVRCPENEIARALITALGKPIAAPSANLSGSPSPTSSAHVIDDMTGRVDMIIDGGDADFGLESTIVKPEDDGSVTLLRPGKITVADLEAVVKGVHVADAVTDKLAEGAVALSPGMKYRHYAPKAPVMLLDGETEDIISYVKADGKDKFAVIAYTEDVDAVSKALPLATVYDFGSSADESEQAHRLFSVLRLADKENFEAIYAPLPKKSGIGLALYNRMIRAAAHKIIRLRR